ncbi:MAG: GNAT family N-acetyltransferase [Candidatus Thorarchaeota archaeon]
MARGWRNESHRHSLSAKGIKTRPDRLKAGGVGDDVVENDVRQLMHSIEERYGIEIWLGWRRSLGVIELSGFIVPKSMRNRGVGSQVMEEVTSFADQNSLKIVLSPSSDLGGSKSRLVKFYKRYGFVENKGRNKNYRIMETMYRNPVGGDIND